MLVFFIKPTPHMNTTVTVKIFFLVLYFGPLSILIYHVFICNAIFPYTIVQESSDQLWKFYYEPLLLKTTWFMNISNS